MYSVNIDPVTYKPVIVPYLYYRSPGNTAYMPYSTPADVGYFYMMGGIYNITLGRWTTARKQLIVELPQKTGKTPDVIEKVDGVTKLVE
jgi:hypothetical protein